FDLIVTAQQVGSYKPARGHFTTARARLPAGARWLHAAQSYFHDVVPCKALGIPVAWINRKRQPVGSAGAPDREFRDLTGLADWVLEKDGGRRQ
ncbi:MAG TPA: HAD family hydrolase, partial [Thermoanaerobaculia bacterium]|nr:HAD family hydrolase [Thermoanaerobaculia bacterium]